MNSRIQFNGHCSVTTTEEQQQASPQQISADLASRILRVSRETVGALSSSLAHPHLPDAGNRILELEEEFQFAQSQIGRLETIKKQHLEDLENMQSEITHLQLLRNEVSNKNAKLREDLKGLTNQNQSLSEEYDMAVKMLEEQMTQNDTFTTNLNNQITNLTTAIENKNNEINKLNEQSLKLKETIEQLSMKNEDLSCQNLALHHDIIHLNVNYEKQIEGLNRSHEEDLHKLQQTLEAQNIAKEILQQKCDQNEQRIVQLNDQMTQQETQRQLLEKEKTGLEDNLESTKTRSKELEMLQHSTNLTNNELEQKKNELEAEKALLSEKLALANERINILQLNETSSQNTQQELRTLCANLEAEKDLLSENLAKTNESLTQNQLKISELNATQTSISVELEQTQNNVSELHELLISKQAEIEKLTIHNDTLRSELSHLQQKFDDLKEEKNTLNQRIVQLQYQHETALANLNAVFERRLDTAKQEHESELSILTNQYESQIQAQQEDFNAQTALFIENNRRITSTFRQREAQLLQQLDNETNNAAERESEAKRLRDIETANRELTSTLAQRDEELDGNQELNSNNNNTKVRKERSPAELRAVILAKVEEARRNRQDK